MSTQGSKVEARNARNVEQNSTLDQESNGSVVNKHKKIKTPHRAVDSGNVQSPARAIDSNSVQDSGDSATKANVSQMEVLINSVKNKDCTVASILSTLLRSSKDLID